jgi:mono/diheme cytochrome c family protein
MRAVLPCVGLVWLCAWGSAFAAEPVDPQPVDPKLAQFFEREIRPLLAERCFKCHGEGKQQGSLRLDIRANLYTGGDSGPAVIPGNPDDSPLIQAVRHETFEMPPDGKLSDQQIEALVQWVKTGAVWPGDNRAAGHIRRPGQITNEDRKWWAFQPVQRPTPPVLDDNNWGLNDIDRFIAEKRTAANLTPAPRADRTTLIRRVTFDLTGLPPTPAEVESFVNDPSPDAYERLVNRLLDSPAYGERMARLWLDLVRYADSDGYRADDYRPNAWRFRDYVIQSFNDDKPYDRFVQEQIAGDELFPGDPQALTATGYYRLGIYEYNIRDARGQWQVILDDITDTTSDVFMGVGLQCARCHDHKFDPLLQVDYYRLQSFFAGILPRDDLTASTADQRAAHAEAVKDWEAKTAELRAQIAEIEARPRASAAEDAITKFPDDVQAMIRKPVAERTPYEHQVAELAYRQVTYEWDRIERKLKADEKDRYLALKKELAKFDNIKPPDLPTIDCVTDLGPQAAEIFVPKRGKEPVEPGFLTILDPEPAAIAPIENNPQTTGRRAALARWLTSPDNPLTARVMVNRLWQQHFGRGLAANASDFGRLGEQPTHPELLDWLAAEFVDRGWSLKELHRLMLLSETYQQSADHPQPQAGRLKDPENLLYWRGSLRRLDAEQLRDALYAVSGTLQLEPHGGEGVAGEQPRRSIYVRTMRNTRNQLLDAFDAPFWMSSAASRHVTTTPIQSLMLINSQFLLKQAEALEKRVRETPGDDRERVSEVYRLLFGRDPSDAEAQAALTFLRAQAARIDVEQATSAAALFEYDRIPRRDGQAALVTPDHAPMRVPRSESFPNGDFTVEAFFVLRSVYDSGAVRVIASVWSGKETDAGWSFGVTGKQSRRKPQTLVLQLIGKNAKGELAHDPVFSDHHIQLNKPYYAAAAVRMARPDGTPGEVTFSLKDLGNDDEPLLTASVPHQIVTGVAGDFPLTIGGRMSSKSDARFDGLIDDVRLSHTALAPAELLFTAEAAQDRTIGFWRFEPEPNVFADVSGHGLDITPTTSKPTTKHDAQRQAWIDLCHVLLNANEFLYVK